MSKWPTRVDYQQALHQPARIFRDPHLQICDVEKKKNQPWARSGNFALVFKLTSATDTHAVRVFLSQQPEREERYRLVNQHLQTHRPGSVVHFTYDQAGVFVQNQWTPLQVMEWVNGNKLGQWVAEQVQQNDVGRLRRMADSWTYLVLDLRRHGIAHGDLQHDNILVDNDRPVLVDYDDMCVASLVGRRQEGVGKPAYQHPLREQQSLSLEIDRFSAWIIWLALRGLASDLSLWGRYTVARDNENLLFTAEDHLAPQQSALWSELCRSRDPEVQQAAVRLVATLPHQPFPSIPPFGPQPVARAAGARPGPTFIQPSRPATTLADTLSDATLSTAVHPINVGATDPLVCRICNYISPPHAVFCFLDGERLPPRIVPMPALPPIPTARPAPPPPPNLDCFAPLRAICSKLPCDWHEIEAEARRLRERGLAAPAELAEIVTEAEQRLACLQRMQLAIGRGALAGIAAAYDPRWMDDWDLAANMVVRGRRAQDLCRKIEELRTALRQTDDGRNAVALWYQYSGDLETVAEAALIRDETLQWQARIQAWDTLSEILQQSEPSERAIVEAADRLDKAGGHPDSGSVKKRVQQARLRAACLDKLPSARGPIGEDYDRRLNGAWDDAILEHCPEAEELRPRWIAALQRLRTLAELGQQIAKVEQGLAPEQSIADFAEARLPPGYVYRYQPRVEQSGTRGPLIARLEKLLAKDRPSDRKIATLWNQLQQAGATLTNGQVERCQLAEQRRDLIERLGKISSQLPLSEQDHRWDKGWDDELLGDCADAESLQSRVLLARQRLEKWRELQAALKNQDFHAVADLADDPLLSDYSLAAFKESVDESRTKSAKVRQFLKWLQNGDATVFVNNVDFAFLRDQGDLLEEHHDTIETLCQEWLNQDGLLAPSQPREKYDAQGNLVQVRWSWPHIGRVTYCWVAQHALRCFDDPREVQETLMNWDSESHRTSSGGIPILPYGLSRSVNVTVWPVIDLGWKKLVGKPLKMASIPIRRRM